MKRTIIEFEPSDRNIVLFSVNDNLIGVNYWQGMGDTSIASGFLFPDNSIDVKLFIGKPLSTAIELIDVLDELIWKSIETKPTLIPKEQRDVIKKALDFYIEMSRKLNSVPTDSEYYELFDARQLIGMMDYPIHIDINKEEIVEFTSKYGIDFPQY